MPEPRTLYAIHGRNTLDYPDGYVVITVAVGRDPNDSAGHDYRGERNIPIVRLNHGYGSSGTLPLPQFYGDFAQRVANYVEMSPGCSRWIIGNEPNHAQERPDGQPITPAQYAECYNLCRAAIHALPGHDADEVLVAAVAPWNVDTKYATNPSGDWLRYFEDVQRLITDCDGFAIHTYTREQTPASITDTARMSPPFEFAYYGFLHFTNWLSAILPQYRGLPVYITEFCIAGQPWANVNTGCIVAAYTEIDDWNALYPDRPISCLAVYRWQYDQWEIKNKPAVQSDFLHAVSLCYTWPPEGEPPGGTMELQNPSFDEGWYNQTPDGNLVLPEGWTAEYRENNDPYKRPEIKPNTEFVTDGKYSIRAFPPAHSRGFYGIWQEVQTTPGHWYRFSVDVRVTSEPPGKLGAMAGIQPWGGSIFHRQMIWGEEIVNSHDWTRVECIAQAFGGKIRVVMGADNEYATANNTTWWDNAKLEKWECGTNPDPDPDPDPNDPVDYARIAQIVEDKLLDRSPVVWPPGAG